MNIRRWIAGALGVVAAGAAVYIVMAPREPRLVFDPAPGESHHYRVGNRVVVDIDGRELDHTVQSHGIVTYRVTNRSPLHLHAGIDLLDLTVNDQPVLASADLGGRDREVAEALRDGFDVTLADNGQLHMQPVNAAAFDRLSEQFEKLAENPLAHAMLGPAVPPGVVAREGATTTLDDFQGFEGLTLTVDALDDARAWLRVEGQIDTLAADASLIQRLAPPDTPIDVSDLHVSARMTVERKHGWIEDMTLVTRLRMAANDKAATMRSITYAHRRDNLTAGSVTASLDGFARLPNAFTEGSELMLAQYSSAFLPPPMYTPPERFDPPEGAQELSAYPGGVMLYLDGGNARAPGGIRCVSKPTSPRWNCPCRLPTTARSYKPKPCVLSAHSTTRATSGRTPLAISTPRCCPNATCRWPISRPKTTAAVGCVWICRSAWIRSAASAPGSGAPTCPRACGARPTPPQPWSNRADNAGI